MTTQGEQHPAFLRCKKCGCVNPPESSVCDCGNDLLASLQPAADSVAAGGGKRAWTILVALLLACGLVAGIAGGVIRWQSVAIGGSAGALAAAVSYGLFRRNSKNAFARIVVFMLVFSGVRLTAEKLLVTEPTQEDIRRSNENAILSVPLYETMRVHYPDVYQRIAATAGDLQLLTTTARPLIAGLVAQNAGRASDDAVISMARMTIDRLELLIARDDTSCFVHLFPALGGTPPQWSREDAEIEAAVINEVLLSAAERAGQKSESNGVDALIEQVMAPLREKYGDDLNMLQEPESAHVDRRKVCLMTRDMYKAILARPAAEAAQTLRFLFTPE